MSDWMEMDDSEARDTPGAGERINEGDRNPAQGEDAEPDQSEGGAEGGAGVGDPATGGDTGTGDTGGGGDQSGADAGSTGEAGGASYGGGSGN